MTRGLVVVGASLAGLRAVEGARRAGFDGPITLIGGEPHPPYDRPPLSKSFLDGEVDVPYYRTGEFLTGELGVRLLLGTPASGLDTDARSVIVGGAEIPYDGLVIATGATARRLPGAGELSGVHTLRTLDDARAVREALEAGPRTVVIGAGFIGSEVASAARKRGLDVTIVEAAPTPLTRALGALGGVCSNLHRVHGTDLRCGAAVEALEGNGRVDRVRLADGTVLDADLVVVGIGAEPETGWLDGSGLVVDNGVVCDESLAASVPGVYAAGDVARWFNPLFGRHMRLEHWSSAAEQGAAAGAAAALPGAAKPYETVPYFWSDWYDTRLQFVGVPEADEVEIALGDVESNRFVALYRAGDRLAGALTVNRPRETMKFRALIARRTGWREALAFTATRR
ncbi:FAD-dependent oxidoreductase [Amycolatopsis cynarae]|uniref:FAD-dependent oxidoreductase n=1 Tax=Amycolatopsis cynarae TaxID=2995223 RepID=A0ABY7B6V5_9PSEU|nr:FAD-dependent oxidoreductase [Amycolatopsis sp. HUAS 11-8]WAL67722.1 FAD-dependent oxidoreductase [Amycolatopsis sp. HUAS 11-8]